MKNSKSLWAVILSVAFFFAVALYCHQIFCGTVRSVQPQPKTIVVDASKSKVTINTKYSNAKFESLGQTVVVGSRGTEFDTSSCNGVLSVILKLRAKSDSGRIINEASKAFSKGKEIAGSSVSQGSSRMSNKLYELNNYASIDLKKVGNSIDFHYTYQAIDPKSAVITFKNIKPSSLPLVRKVGPLTLTLEKVYYGNAKSPHAFLMSYPDGECDKWFVTEYTLEGPPDNFQGMYTITSDGCESNTTSPNPYWFDRDNIKVMDESRNELTYVGSTMDDLGKGSEVFSKETERRTRLESFIARVNPEKASQMITNRAYLKAIKCNGKFRFYEFYKADSLPKTFTWEATVYPELKHRERQRIIFKNIPVPPAKS